MRVIAQNLPPESTLVEKVFVSINWGAVSFWLFLLHVFVEERETGSFLLMEGGVAVSFFFNK